MSTVRHRGPLEEALAPHLTPDGLRASLRAALVDHTREEAGALDTRILEYALIPAGASSTGPSFAAQTSNTEVIEGILVSSLNGAPLPGAINLTVGEYQIGAAANVAGFVLLHGLALVVTQQNRAAALVAGGSAAAAAGSTGVVAAPAAGANPGVYTVPAAMTLQAVTTTFTSSAVVANRIVALIIKDPAGNLISETIGSTAIAASSPLDTVTFLPGVAVANPSGGFYYGPLPPVTLAAGSTLQITTISGGIQAGDQYGPVTVSGSTAAPFTAAGAAAAAVAAVALAPVSVLMWGRAAPASNAPGVLH